MRREARGCASLSNNKSRVANHLTTSQGGENKSVQSDQPVHRYTANSATLLAQEALPMGNLSLGTKPLAKSRPTLGPHPGSARLGRQLGTRQTWPALSRPIPPFPAISRLRARNFFVIGSPIPLPLAAHDGERIPLRGREPRTGKRSRTIRTVNLATQPSRAGRLLMNPIPIFETTSQWSGNG